MDETDPFLERRDSVPWDEIVRHYRENYDGDLFGGKYRPMLRLVEEIAASPFAAHLFGRNTSAYVMRPDRQGQLNLSRTRTIITRHQMLAVSFVPEDDWFLFEYFEAAYDPKPWATCCARDEGFAKLEWVLNRRLRWFKRPEAGSGGIMKVRLLGDHDDAEWLRMRDALWPGLPTADHGREMADYRTRPTMTVFVVDRGDGRLGGFLEAATREFADGCETSPVGYIEGWYVDPDLRRSGLGGALVAAAEDWARARGYAEMASDCLVENTISFTAHSSLGYREVERLIHFRKPLTGDI
jgi:aminoglycoside 6'-N-acetyltransferase I